MTKKELIDQAFDALKKLSPEQFQTKMNLVQQAYANIPNYIDEPTPVFIRRTNADSGSVEQLEVTEYHQALSEAYVPQAAYDFLKQELALVVKIGVESQREVNRKQFEEYKADITKLTDALLAVQGQSTENNIKTNMLINDALGVKAGS